MGVGYGFGGDGESRLQLDLHKLSANLHDMISQQAKRCLQPFDGEGVLKSHIPKRMGQKETTTFVVSFSEMCWVFHLKQVKILRNCINKFSLLGSENRPETAPSTSPFHPNVFHFQLLGQSLKIQMVDDRDRWLVETLCRASVDDCRFNYRTEQTVHLSPVQTSADFKGALQVTVFFHPVLQIHLQIEYMNAALDAMDPFIESWPFSFEYLDSGLRKAFTLMSTETMNILATPAVIDPLAEILHFTERCTSSETLARLSSSRTASKYDSGDRPTSKYKIVNKSGIALSYWVDAPNATQAERFSVMAEESAYLAVVPVSKAVLLPHANTRVKKSPSVCFILKDRFERIQFVSFLPGIGILSKTSSSTKSENTFIFSNLPSTMLKFMSSSMSPSKDSPKSISFQCVL